MAGPCLSASELQEFLFGSLPQEEWARLRSHLAECETCRAALAPLFPEEAAGNGGPASRPGAAVQALVPPPRRGAPASSLGWTLGHYRVLEELGRGGQGNVYLAEDSRLGRKVALKVLSAALGASSSTLERFRREAMALSKLDHPGLCTVYDAGEIDGIQYIAMRHVEGETLSSLLASRARQAPGSIAAREDLARWMLLLERTARALHAAHEAGLVHRDVKPGNIMVTRDAAPVVLDFGLVRDETWDLQGLTRSGDVMGTPAYMSPEQLSGGGERLDRRSDVYSLGVTLYQCLTLRLPFEAPTREALFQRILTAEPQDPRRFNPGVPRDLKVVLETALDKSPARRYPTALAFAEDLRRVLEYEPIRARPAGPFLRFARWTQRNPALATSAIALFVMLSVALSISLVLLERVSKEELAKRMALEREKAQGAALSAALAEKETAFAAKDAALTRAEALRLAALASGARPSNPGLALLLALEAKGVQPSVLATNVLLECLGELRERRTLVGHEWALNAIRLSPDGRHAVTASSDGDARVWEVATGREAALLRGHAASVRTACFNPLGSRILTASDDGTARIWKFPGGRCLSTLRGHTSPVVAASFSPDGLRAATASRDGTARIWTSSSGGLAAVLKGHTGTVHSAVFSPDGRRVLTGGEDGTARTWDASSGEEGLVIREGGSVRLAVFSPDGRWILTADLAGQAARIRDASTGAMLADLEMRSAPSAVAVFSPDGRRLAFTAGRRAVRIVETGAWSKAVELAGHRGYVCCAAFSPDGRRLLTGAKDGTARLWDAESGDRLAELAGHGNFVVDACFTPDGSRALTASVDGTARIWDVEERADVVRIPGREEPFRPASFSPDGEKALAASGNAAYIFDARSGKELRVLRGHQHAITAAVFSPGGGKVATASYGFTGRIWDAETGGQIAVLSGHGAGIGAIAFSPDGLRVLTSSWDGTVRFWSLDGREIWRLEVKNRGSAAPAVFSPDGLRVLVVDSSGARVVSAADRALLASWNAAAAADPRDVCFSPDGSLVMAAPWGEIVHLWNACDGRLFRELRSPVFGSLNARFSPDGSRIVTASHDGLARIWDAGAARLLATCRGHEGRINSALFGPDGRSLLTASADGTARLWDAAGGQERCAFEGAEGEVASAVFSPDGSRVLTTADDGTLRIWPADPVPVALGRRPRALTPDERDLYEVGPREARQLRRVLWSLRKAGLDLWLLILARLRP